MGLGNGTAGAAYLTLARNVTLALARGASWARSERRLVTSAVRAGRGSPFVSSTKRPASLPYVTPPSTETEVAGVSPSPTSSRPLGTGLLIVTPVAFCVPLFEYAISY